MVSPGGRAARATKARSMGREASDKELGIIVSQVRKYLSTSLLRAQSLCLLNRLGFLGEGARKARPSQQTGGGEEKGETGTLPGQHLWSGPLPHGPNFC